MLEVEKLKAFYGPAQALFDVSLQLRRGEFVVTMTLEGTAVLQLERFVDRTHA